MAGQNDHSANERRGAKRRVTTETGRIDAPELRYPIECKVQVQSATGARIKLKDDVSVPDRFRLTIESHGSILKCEVIWRGAGELSIRFV